MLNSSKMRALIKLQKEISDIMGAGAVSMNYTVNAARINQDVETKQLVDVEVKDISDKVTMMYHNQIDMMSTQLQQLRVMLKEKEQEEQELKDKLTFEYQNNVNLRAQLQEQVTHFETQIHVRDENARKTYEEQNAQNQQMVTDLKRELNAIKVNLESKNQKEIADALAKSQREQLQKLEEEHKMRLELQNQLQNNESRLFVDEQMIIDLQQECKRQME